MAGAVAIAPLWEARNNLEVELLSETAGSWYQVAGVLRNSGFVLVGLLLLALPAAGQITLGELSTNATGTLSAGYTGDYGNQISSDHSMAFGGTGTLDGFYYNPNFCQLHGFAIRQSVAGQLDVPIPFQCQRSQRGQQYFRRQPFSGIRQFRQGLQQRRQLFDPGSGQLHHAWRQ